MTNTMFISIVLFCASVPGTTRAQEIQVSRENRTISVTITETVRVEAEVAVLSVGFRNYGRTKEAAFEENVRVANQITKALLDAGIPKEFIETEKLALEHASDSDWTPEQKKERQYEARQQWRIRTGAGDAQRVLDLAVRTGANEIGDVTWTVSDPVELDAKANSAALQRARALAERMAKEMGKKAGDLLHLSNTTDREKFVQAFWLKRSASLPESKLKLFPEKVKQQASVHAVFALE